MAKTKAVKKVTAKIAIAYNEKGRYEAYGDWDHGKLPTDQALTEELLRWWPDNSCVSIIEVELEVPQPLKAKVLKVKRVKR